MGPYHSEPGKPDILQHMRNQARRYREQDHADYALRQSRAQMQMARSRCGCQRAPTAHGRYQPQCRQGNQQRSKQRQDAVLQLELHNLPDTVTTGEHCSTSRTYRHTTNRTVYIRYLGIVELSPGGDMIIGQLNRSLPRIRSGGTSQAMPGQR